MSRKRLENPSPYGDVICTQMVDFPAEGNYRRKTGTKPESTQDRKIVNFFVKEKTNKPIKAQRFKKRGFFYITFYIFFVIFITILLKF